MTAGRYEERRAFERALHDGVQQALVALSVNLQLARERCASDPARLAPLLDELRRDVHAALDDVQMLGHALYPPVLADHGVAEALRAVAPGTRVEAPPERFAPEVEAAAYFACVDALDGVRPKRIRLWEEHGALRFELE